ncbi:DNA-directed RNA polymerase III subunit RPC7-like [Sabethes cyaneus]|uniref:DNA-directed RNA polymerase III subunit RPC7-like n=1 Tax=Sabethes cyaneus TaxID=53552 RepID=UPI00237ED80F|nr:DNA-directed RNA polymerase III subunit RPC7-like [Sabethes cyaneus]XP_053683576.1 DNA-directed RNA polymerase III subunit RPC7-like [Sabethes cyaneus]XP_053683577.1 DNA-directed RNA polymerase III subunit RPC7-like [Sabethes cyaneus]
MAGRGRGKSTGTLTQEQLQSMGVTRNEMQTVSSAAPPPLYPILQSKPVPLESNPDRDYKILWKEDFISYLRESPYYTTVKCSKSPVERYSDKVINVIENDPKRKQDGGFIWSMMPAELRPTFKRSKPAGTIGSEKNAAKRSKVVDIDAKLSALEKKESFLDAEVKKEKHGDSDEDDEQEEEMVDEEMDDENDYGNNYFDNGEAYNEEDDNLDDGPVY